MDTRKKQTPKRIKGRAAAVFFLALLLLLGLSHTQVKRQVEEQKLRATYTAENTVRRIESQLNRYVEKSDLLAEFEDTVFMYGSRLKQEGITLNYTPSDEPVPEIPCDVARMRQVFLNILDNAAKHGGDGKRIDASLDYENGSVVVRIRDYGPGIPEDELPHVKMKFYKGSSKARGSGIGLAVCEEIVSMHGGTLTLENAEGGGTLVTISIPAGEE